MKNQDLEMRMAAIEKRLGKLESLLLLPDEKPQKPPAHPSSPPEKENIFVSREAMVAPVPKDSIVTSLLGWGGAFALVMAGAYLIRLAIDSGWLNPTRQVMFAAVAGFVLIGVGFALKPRHPRYSGLLPAGGIVILFLSVYGAQIFYGLIGPVSAGAAVAVISLLSLVLCRVFASDLFAFFAVFGSYSAPFLLAGPDSQITDLVLYYSVWSVIFCVFALWHGRRTIYLLALYLALIGFDLAFRAGAGNPWVPALAFQTAQFLIFGVTIVLFSVRKNSPLDSRSALAHLPAVIIFYFIQYALLNDNVPAWAPWIAFLVPMAAAGFYFAARSRLEQPMPGGELIVWTFVALAVFHAGYLESVPYRWKPWTVLIFAPLVYLAIRAKHTSWAHAWPVWMGIALVFLENYLTILIGEESRYFWAGRFVSIPYAAVCYTAYYLSGETEKWKAYRLGWLYAAHLVAMAGAIQIFDEPMIQSTVWAALAVVSLFAALRFSGTSLGQSSLLIFGATAAKVLLYDLAGADPVVRIISLVVLGVLFYFGGMLYQRVQNAADKLEADS